MKLKILVLCIGLPLISFSQFLKEDLILFNLNSDNDALINIVDNDDDNDSVLDNLDYYPLDATRTLPGIVDSISICVADAPLRSNSNNASNTNYGSDALSETKNDKRSLLLKFLAPANVEFNHVTLTLHSSTEDDPLVVYFVPNTSWLENVVTANNIDLTDMFQIGETTSPINGEYTFSIPTFVLPENGGEFSLLVYDENDPNGSKEFLYTKETPGEEPSILFNYNVLEEERVTYVESSSLTNTYVDGSPISIDFKLTQMPSDTVWIPFAVSDPNLGAFVGDEVLVFTPDNWDQVQTMNFNPSVVDSFDILVKPIHSNDSFFNGNNPDDIQDCVSQQYDITNLTNWMVGPCDTFNLTLNSVGGQLGDELRYTILTGPSGLNVIEESGEINFRPLGFQIDSTYEVSIKVENQNGESSFFTTDLSVQAGTPCDPVGVFVDLNAEDAVNENGSPMNPYHDLKSAMDVLDDIGGNIFIRGGEFTLTNTQSITQSGQEGNPIIIQPVPGEHVKFNFDLNNAFFIRDTSRYIEIRGLEVDGGTDGVDFWCIVAQALWGDETIPRGGGIAFNVSGEFITITNNYIHDCYQKAVEITGRYINVDQNVIRSIATTSLSGGHGIMRQQKGREFLEDDLDGIYRWDLKENILFNVEQRIYSWVPLKGFMEMTLDEGKPILLDEAKDEDGFQENFTARVNNNIVAFGSIDAIRIKNTPNLEVSYNTVFSEGSHADGITDVNVADSDFKFSNCVIKNNAVQTGLGTTALDVKDIRDSILNDTMLPFIQGNFIAQGGVVPNGEPGAIIVNTNNLFTDPLNGNFAINSSLAIGDTMGVEPLIQQQINDRANRFGTTIEWDRWETDHRLLTQTIFDNIPNLYDDISGNETVLGNYGVMDTVLIKGKSRVVIDFPIVDGQWKMDRNIDPDTTNMRFILNEEYADWYKEVNHDHKSKDGDNYTRIRWGGSYLKHDHVFQDDWLIYAEVSSDTNTVIYGPENQMTLDGDLLVHFNNVTPEIGDCFDLIIGQSIAEQSPGVLFDSVYFDGFQPDSFSVEVVSLEGNREALRLKILEKGTCSLMVINTNDIGTGSLRKALSCSTDGDTIILSSLLANDTIKISSIPLVIDKSVFINSIGANVILQNCTNSMISTAPNKMISLQNFTILSDMVTNESTLNCTDMTFKSKLGDQPPQINNQNGGSVIVRGSVEIRE